ncbi:urease accessory protein UreF [Limnobacter sp.]|uniref:urease accessory protein UreF n=1 Tax=Limnobacter sp. TaxID=2003368 RepID=UPI002FE409CC
MQKQRRTITTITTMTTNTIELKPMELVKLMHLCSVSLPVGAYSFSQGMEYAIDAGWVKSPDQVHDWLECQLLFNLARVDLPLLARCMHALRRSDFEQLAHWNDFLIACRETRELRLTDMAMGEALLRLLPTLGVDPLFAKREPASFVTLFAVACTQWNISLEGACLGFAWAWLENQVAAATKLVPLGQTQAQALVAKLQPMLPDAVILSSQVNDDQLGSCLPGLALASALHETQYSRLFRS